MKKKSNLINNKDRNNYIIEFLIIFFFIVIRYVYYGFRYFPQLDDYIQYHNYALYFSTSADSLWQFIEKLGLLGQRPLAALADIYVWTAFFKNMIVVIFILSALYTVSAIIFRKIFNKLFGTGYFFTAVFCLLPLGFEGLYWISASARIILGVFLASVSAYCFDKFCTNPKKKKYLIPFVLMQLLCFGFYEQSAVFSLALTFITALTYFKKESLWGLLGLLTPAVYFIYAKVMGKIIGPDGIYAGRTELSLPFISPDYFTHTFKNLINNFKNIYIKGTWYTMSRGFYRGIKIIINDKPWLYLIILLSLFAITVLLLKRNKKPEKGKLSYIFSILFGIVLIFAPLAPFFILKSSWVSLRAAASSLCGIALVSDSLLRLICFNKRVPVLITIILFAFGSCVAGVSEIHDYKLTYETDKFISESIINECKNYDNSLKIGILNLRGSYLESQNYSYNEHIKGVTSSSWALFGAMQYYSGISSVPNVTPIPIDGEGYYYYVWSGDTYKLGNFDLLFIYDGIKKELIPLTVTQNEDLSYSLYFKDGKLCGNAYEYQDYGICNLKYNMG